MAEFLIGIDLGTTNSAIAYASMSRPGAARSFAVEQLVAQGEVGRRPTLPSALYLSDGQDVPDIDLALPWPSPPGEVVGVFANTLGTRQSGRLVSSAKSWLCHGGVDRTTGILPWGSPVALKKLSPVEASSRYLQHLAACWEEAHPDHRVADQDLILAVPASFDEVARELTVAAAEQAGFGRVRLLEEPQAALYAWTAAHEDWQSRLEGVGQILVVDVGGGTTDFSLVAARRNQGSLSLERTFVGDHLLVGGDNMDLALSHEVAREHRRALDSARWQQLTLQVRLAKEEVMEHGSGVDAVEIAVAGAGRRLLGNTIRSQLTRAMTDEILVEGFFPMVDRHAVPETGAAGLQEFGLPFAADPAITRHLAGFLNQAGNSVPDAVSPDAVLFNGGALKPLSVRARVLDQLEAWFGRRPTELGGADHDLAVARGAVAYGSALRGHGERISGGSARSYFLGVAGQTGSEMVCAVSRGMVEGDERVLGELDLELSTNQQVQFPLYVSTTRMGDEPGKVYPYDNVTTVALPPLSARLRFGKSLEARPVPVKLRTVLAETGTLEVWCEAQQTPHRWKLSFDLRAQASSEAWEQEDAVDAAVADAVVGAEQLSAAKDTLAAAFRGDRDPVRITPVLEEHLGLGRAEWPLGAMRELWEAVWSLREYRSRSADHEARWLNLCGYLLRPGFGNPGDDLRAEKVWRLFNAGLNFPKSSQCGAEWWVLWKRLAGGLSRPQQTALLDTLRSIILPGNKRKKNRKKASAQQIREMWQVAGSLERVPAGQKAEVFGALLRDQKAFPSLSDAEVWALGRLGARCPVYGPADTVLSPEHVVPAAEAIVGFSGTLSGPWALALAQLARRSGDRARDLPELLREQCAERLQADEKHRELAAIVSEVQPTSASLGARIVADSLPSGLRLARADDL